MFEDVRKKFLPVMRRFLDYLSSLSIAYKLILFAVLGAIAGHSYFGLIGQYATYYFAWDTGIRLPFEGLPFYSLLMSIVGFSVSILLIILLFYLLFIWYYALYVMTWYAKHFIIQPAEGFNKKRKKYSNRSFKLYQNSILTRLSWPDFFASVIVASIPTFGVASLLLVILSLALGVSLIDISNFPFNWHSLILFGVVLIILIYNRKPKLSLALILICCVLLLGFLSGSFFSKENIGAILRGSRFGGGSKILLIQNCKGQESCNPTVTGCLILRTDKAVTLIDSKTDEFTEVPTDKILGYQYSQNPELCMTTEK